MGEKRKVAFVGAGAAGSFVGGKLAKAHRDAILIDAWPEHIATIKERGLVITDTRGRTEVEVEALHIHEVQRLASTPVDIAFICTKAYDSEWAAALIKDYLAPGACVVSLQNGFNEERIDRILQREPVMGCVASTLSVEMVGPGHVIRTYEPAAEIYDVFRVGEIDGQITSRLREVVDLLSLVDNAKPTSNLFGERWSKLVANSMANPVSAITGLRDKEMSRNRDVRRLCMKLGVEAVSVGRALGHSLVPIFGVSVDRWVAAGEGKDIEQLDQDLIKAAARATDQGRPSTPLDIELGRRTELEFFNGLVIAKGGELGIPTPVNDSVLKLVKRVERGELEPSVENLKQLRKFLD